MTQNALPNLCMIGCGNMGSALLRGYLKTSSDTAITVVKPSNLPDDLSKSEGITYAPSLDAAKSDLKSASCILLAVKPQILSELLEDLKPIITPDTLIISVAAGTSLDKISKGLAPDQPTIRVMPNTPAQIGKGAHVACANKNVSDTHKNWCEEFFSPTGVFEWIADDALMNAVTALSGSGPAYVFYLIEVLSTAGQKSGLSLELSEKLARQTVIGAAALAEAENQTSPATLRENVTSPGGTTEAALETLMDGRMQDLFDEALEAAVQRGKDLNNT